jgi:hypothetical protein
MGFVHEERLSDSPYVETITRGRTEGEGQTIRPAESCWHMVLVRYQGERMLVLTGSLTTSGTVSYTAGAEILWIKFKLGTFMPHLPARDLLDRETLLPEAASESFWLKGSAWQFPDYENVETFVDRLVREQVLVHDPLVPQVLNGHTPGIAPRTVRHRFLRATGLTQGHIIQFERAKRAETLLQQGLSILDTVNEVGYYDQPHLTRSLKLFTGQTPAQILKLNQFE